MMKKLLDAAYLSLGTICFFGLPSATLAVVAYFGDTIMTWMHASATVMHSAVFQVEAIGLMFGTAAGGLVATLTVFTGLWKLVTMLGRMADRLEVLPTPPRLAPSRTPQLGEARTVGRFNRDAATSRRRSAASAPADA